MARTPTTSDIPQDIQIISDTLSHNPLVSQQQRNRLTALRKHIQTSSKTDITTRHCSDSYQISMYTRSTVIVPLKDTLYSPNEIKTSVLHFPSAPPSSNHNNKNSNVRTMQYFEEKYNQQKKQIEYLTKKYNSTRDELDKLKIFIRMNKARARAHNLTTQTLNSTAINRNNHILSNANRIFAKSFNSRIHSGNHSPDNVLSVSGGRSVSSTAAVMSRIVPRASSHSGAGTGGPSGGGQSSGAQSTAVRSAVMNHRVRASSHSGAGTGGPSGGGGTGGPSGGGPASSGGSTRAVSSGGPSGGVPPVPSIPCSHHWFCSVSTLTGPCNRCLNNDPMTDCIFECHMCGLCVCYDCK
eukprot:236860_1